MLLRCVKVPSVLFRLFTQVALSLASVLAWTMLVLSPGLLSAQQLYWSQFGSPSLVGHVNLDGSGSVTALTGRSLGMETLDSTRQVYWADNITETIMRANADFSGVTTLVTGLVVPSHLNLALDPDANLMFWSNANAGTIGRASLGGGPIISTFASLGGYPDDIAVDPHHRLLYWTDQTGEVVRSQYDGSSQVVLMKLGTHLGSGASGLDLDLSAGKMYMSVPNQNVIVRANLDGTGLETLLSTSERPFGMELFNGRMYWADLDGGRLRSANVDGSGLTTILSGLNQPRQVSIMAVPESSTIVLLGIASFSLLAYAWRWRKR
jgi:hypothetical protein